MCIVHTVSNRIVMIDDYVRILKETVIDSFSQRQTENSTNLFRYESSWSDRIRIGGYRPFCFHLQSTCNFLRSIGTTGRQGVLIHDTTVSNFVAGNMRWGRGCLVGVACNSPEIRIWYLQDANSELYSYTNTYAWLKDYWSPISTSVRGW
jgi:hypothetical protein